MNPRLSGWENFYVIVGSSGAALIGIQFVVMTLIGSMRRRAPADTVSAFGTPTVVHFAFALIISALMSAPWRSLVAPSIALGFCGLFGLTYCGWVIHRARKQTGYEPLWEDWLWYSILPFSVYAALAGGAFFLRTATQLAMFFIGASALGLLLIGIHNAWDSVTHIVITRPEGDHTDAE